MGVHNPAAFVATFDNTCSVVLPFKDGADLTVDWGDGTVEHTTANRPSHIYPHTGRWTVSVTGRAQTMTECDPSVVEVARWGRLGLTCARDAFTACENLTTVPNGTDGLEAVTDMSYMFFGTHSLNHPIGNWDVSAVTNMSGMFASARAFNRPLGRWDVSAVTNADYMFCRAAAFNQPLNSWDTSAVTSMYGMFEGAETFSQPLNSWDVSAVTDMYSMFDGAVRFFQDLSCWNVRSGVTPSRMFRGTAMVGRMLPAHVRTFLRSNPDWDYVEDVDLLPNFRGL